MGNQIYCLITHYKRRNFVVFIKKASDFLQYITGIFLGSIVTILMLILSIGIISRFIFNFPLIWTYEFSIICFVWLIFMGMAYAFKSREHMKLTFITNSLHGRTKQFWIFLIDIVCIFFLICAVFAGISISISTWPQYYNTIPLRKGLFYLSMPISGTISIIHLINYLINEQKNEK